jgi:O-antigen ligase
MSTAVAVPQQAPALTTPAAVRAATRHGFGFFLFLLVNAALFVRAGEIVPALVGWNVYEFLILACLAVSFPAILQQFSAKSLEERPVMVCVVGLLIAVVLSHLAQLHLAEAATDGVDFFKVALYYMLFVALVDSPARLRTFLFWMLIFGAATVALAVLQYYGAITLPNLDQIVDAAQDKATGADVHFMRLTGSGIFHDPNELGVLISVLIVVSLYWLTDRRSGVVRFLWFAPLGFFLYAMTLTQSRGALLALMAGLAVLLVARFGLRIALAASIVILPLLLFMPTRQTDFSTQQGTAQDRLQIWSDALMTWRYSPLFGVGRDAFRQAEGLVVHNSYLQMFVDLGLVGGMLFLGAFYLAVERLWRLGNVRKHAPLDPEAHRLHPYICGMVACYSMGMMSLTLSYVLPTYTILALATAFVRTSTVKPALPAARFDLRLLGRLAIVAIGGFGVLYLWVRLFMVH